MIFASVTFLFVFLPITLFLYYISRRDNIRNIILLAASLIFYAWGEPKYILLMLGSISVNYFVGLLLGKYKSKIILGLGVTVNLCALFIFKYCDFAVLNINALFHTTVFEQPSISLPIGISFYTFQAVSYLIDVYRKDVKAQLNPFDFALYISMFPQLIAGPIVRYSTVAEEIKRRNVSLDKEGSYC